jgi:hypothetical protein
MVTECSFSVRRRNESALPFSSHDPISAYDRLGGIRMAVTVKKEVTVIITGPDVERLSLLCKLVACSDARTRRMLRCL